MGVVTIGVDVGQKRDPSAIAVLEEEVREERTHYLTRHLERQALGTPYPDVARRVGEIAARLRSRSRSLERTGQQFSVTIYVDATGVGTPIVDLMREYGESPIAVYFTHGDRRTETHDQVSLGKGWLVSRLQALFQAGRIHLPTTGEAVAMRQELIDYEIRVNEKANDIYGAFRTGSHDDLVTALGLAVGTDRHGSEITAASYLTPPRKLDARGRPYPYRRCNAFATQR